MPTVVATPADAAANSYATVQEFKDYWGARPYATVPAALSDADIILGLIWTGILMDAAFNWKGTATTDAQAMCWPRTGLLSKTGRSLDSMTVPQQLKNAQIQWAGQIFIDGSDRTLDDPDGKVMTGEAQVQSVKAGPVSVSFDNNRFSSLESFDAFVRSLGQDFEYLSKAVPDAVRILLVDGWYVEAQLKRKVIFGAF